MSDVETALTGAEVAPIVSATAETQTAPESTPEQVEATPQERDEKGRFVPQERLNEVTRHRRDAERRADSLERELQQYRQQPAQHQPQSNDAPTLEAFNYDMPAWSHAMTEHVTQKVLSQSQQHAQQQEQQRYQQQIAQSFDDKAKQYAATNPGFEDRLEQLSRTVQFSPYVVEAVGSSDHGPAIVDYLAKHLDEADSISRLPPHIAALQLGRIEAKVTAQKAKPVTNAPNPAPTLGGGSANPTKNENQMETAEFIAHRNKTSRIR
jgi:hypothetical protein